MGKREKGTHPTMLLADIAIFTLIVTGAFALAGFGLKGSNA